MAKRGAFARLLDHFHTHPSGRLHEFLFWAGLGALLLLGAWWGYRTDFLNAPIALILVVLGISLLLWSLLPQRKPKPKPAPNPRSKRKV